MLRLLLLLLIIIIIIIIIIISSIVILLLPLLLIDNVFTRVCLVETCNLRVIALLHAFQKSNAVEGR